MHASKIKKWQNLIVTGMVSQRNEQLTILTMLYRMIEFEENIGRDNEILEPSTDIERNTNLTVGHAWPS